MATNQYHLLHRIPAVEAWEMPPALEALAQQFVRSGQLRIHADHERNYVRHGTADSDATFTARELTDPALSARTRQILAKHVPPAAGPEALDALVARLLVELKKARGIAPDKELRVARIVAQSAHPSVIHLLLRSGTAVYVSYSHNVADLMAVHDWQTHGTASGLQATAPEGTAVYISCGGDPFFAGEHKNYTTDGFPALARMIVIGGQELGHFSDLLRGPDGSIHGRYSTDNNAHSLRAAPVIKAGRREDMAHIAHLETRAIEAGLAALTRAESAVAFYDKRMRFTLPWLLRQCLRAVQRLHFGRRSKALGIDLRFAVHPRMRHGDALATYLSDMAFNLAPESDAYRRADPEAEEAIACIEALARVPQQVFKWGHANVQFGWPRLYAAYYNTVIPGCIAAARTPLPAVDSTLLQAFGLALRRRLRKKPQYYPETGA